MLTQNRQIFIVCPRKEAEFTENESHVTESENSQKTLLRILSFLELRKKRDCDRFVTHFVTISW
jgi:hypothetical protein